MTDYLESRTPPEALPPNPVILAAARAMLAPILMWQGVQVRRSTPRLPEPEGPREGVVGEGPVGLRLLVVGDSTAAGVGVETQDQALAPRIARELVGHGHGAVSWQVIARTGLSARATLGLMASSKILPADVMVTALGINDVLEQISTGQWLRYLNAIHHHGRGRAGVRHTVHCAPPRLDLLPLLPGVMKWVMGGAALMLDEALLTYVNGARRRSRYVMPYDPTRDAPATWLSADGFHPSGALYERWAAGLAAHIHTVISYAPEANATRPSGFGGLDTLR
jgi:lysophospholipase L1-like esterase